MTLAQRGRGITVLGFLTTGSLGLLSATQVWLAVTWKDAAEPIQVTGGEVLPLLTPLSLAVLALGGVLTLVGTVLRRVFAILGTGAAVLLGWSTLPVLTAPGIDAVAAAVTNTTGLAGDEAIAQLVAEVTPTGWPVADLVGWLLLLATAIFALFTAGSWKSGGRRYRTNADYADRSGPVDAVSSWDELSHGTDPTARPIDGTDPTARPID